MSAYNVWLENRETGELVEVVGEFYTLRTAEREAEKASRRLSSPDVLAVMRWHSPSGLPRYKAWRMGRVYRHPSTK